MASSTHHQHPMATPYGTTAAPPPTPSTQPNFPSTSDAADALSRLLHRLPPTLSSLSFPSRRPSPSSSSSTLTTPPLVSLSEPTSSINSNLLSASQLGFFQLTDHSVSSQLANSAESDSLSLFNLPSEQKHLLFPKNWPFGYDAADEDDDESSPGESLVLDSACSTESNELKVDSLKEFTHEMEKLGLEVLEALACAVGFENPVKVDPTRVCSLMWISETRSNNKAGFPDRFYPYVIGLQFQIRCQKYSMLADSGWVSVKPQVDSVLVTLGDIAQVWSNGKMKKVRGRPMPSVGDGNNNSQCITMSLLITLPIDSTVSPLLPQLAADGDEDEENKEEEVAAVVTATAVEEEEKCDVSSEERKFKSFSFEDYAWRVYHERLLLKDPLVRYRV